MVNNGFKVIRAGVIGLEILDELTHGTEKYITEDGKHRHRQARKYKEINGVDVKLSSDRYPVFKESQVCCKCGLVATFFGIECTDIKHTKKYHLNLYGINAKGDEVLFTKDHIVPQSKGGRNAQFNYQTMCIKCNGEKGNKNE